MSIYSKHVPDKRHNYSALIAHKCLNSQEFRNCRLKSVRFALGVPRAMLAPTNDSERAGTAVLCLTRYRLVKWEEQQLNPQCEGH